MTLERSVIIIAAAGSLIVAPLVSAATNSTRFARDLDALVLVLVAGTVGLHVAPLVVSAGGFWALLALCAGGLAPWVASKTLGSTRAASPLLAASLMMHAALEGAALGAVPSFSLSLVAALVAYWVPTAIAVFRGLGGGRWAWSLLYALVVAILVGAMWGGQLPMTLTPSGGAVVQALAAGFLLSLVLRRLPSMAGHDAHAHHHDHDHHDHDHHDHGHHHPGEVHSHGGAPTGAIGAVAGCALLAVQVVQDTGNATVARFFERLADITIESAPALVAGYVLAGLISAFWSPATKSWLSGGSELGRPMRGIVFGLPLPICSCGVLPMYRSLIKVGAPPVAAMSFLIATPELGLDAILLSWPLLGGPLTLARLLAAIVVAGGVALFVGRGIPQQTGDSPVHGGKALPASDRLRAGLRHGLVEVFDHTAPWVAVGIVVAALLQPLLQQGSFSQLAAVAQVPLLVAVSVPLYVCASGATPLAAALIAGGVSPGAALAFLIAGPATNVTTFGVLSQLHGKRVARGFGVTMAAAAIGLGWCLDSMPNDWFSGYSLAPSAHYSWSPLQTASTALLLLLLLASLVRQGPQGMVEQVLHPSH